MANRFSPSPTMQWHPESNTYYNMFTHTYVQHYQRGARQTIQNQKEGTIGKKTKQKYKYLPCWNPQQWKKDRHWIQKYHKFIYQTASVGSCSGIHSFFFPENLSTNRISYYNLSVFFDYHLQSQLSNAHCIAAYMTCSWRFTACEPSFFTLQNYNSIHIFSSLMLVFFTLLKYNYFF